MHEGKHGILDGVDDMDDVFGVKDDKDAAIDPKKASKVAVKKDEPKKDEPKKGK
jgi:hypothetical protein